MNCALYAKAFLKRDRDYIVRNSKIELVDEFTGPACTAAMEFQEFYGMNVVVIPTNKPCIRKDHPLQVFSHKEAKEASLVEYIAAVNKCGRPVLIGTDSIEESELLTAALKKADVNCQVLNAKNDEIEAKIIAKAGEFGAVTVSTNMAGRGVDIKLGGETGQERNKVISLGGLLVIGTCLHESRRMTDQLRGRAARQGDPGETRFFISIEDELVQRYNLIRMIPKRNLPHKKSGPINDEVVRRQLVRGQRIVEGYNSDLRRQLLKYSFIIEQQRRIIHRKRQDIMIDKVAPELLATKAGELFWPLCSKYGHEVLKRVEKQITLYQINKHWADYLAYMAYVRESIHLVVIGKKNPLDEFHKIAISAFDEMLVDKIDSEIVKTFREAEITENGIDMDKEGLKVPSSTWTYLINEDQNQFSNLQNLIKVASTVVSKPLFTLQDIYNRVFRRT